MGQRWQTEESRNVGAQQELEEQCVAIWLQVRHKCCHASSGKRCVTGPRQAWINTHSCQAQANTWAVHPSAVSTWQEGSGVMA